MTNNEPSLPDKPKMAPCLSCGYRFYLSRKWSLFCSNSCRYKHHSKENPVIKVIENGIVKFARTKAWEAKQKNESKVSRPVQTSPNQTDQQA